VCVFELKSRNEKWGPCQIFYIYTWIRNFKTYNNIIIFIVYMYEEREKKSAILIIIYYEARFYRFLFTQWKKRNNFSSSFIVFPTIFIVERELDRLNYKYVQNANWRWNWILWELNLNLLYILYIYLTFCSLDILKINKWNLLCCKLR
jgi:hypothetical protein